MCENRGLRAEKEPAASKYCASHYTCLAMSRALISAVCPVIILNSFLTFFWVRDTLFHVCVWGSEGSNGNECTGANKHVIASEDQAKLGE